MNLRTRKQEGPVIIENINIHVKHNKNTQMLPSSREMHVKMNLSNENSEFQLTNNDYIAFTSNRDNSLFLDSKHETNYDLMQQIKVPFDIIGPTQYSFNSNNSNSKQVERKEEGQQCDFDDIQTQQITPNSNSRNLRLRTPAHTNIIGSENTNFMDKRKTSTTQNYYTLIREQQKSSITLKPDYSKVKQTQSQVRNFQIKHLSNISDNVRPKSQNMMTKITRQKEKQYDQQQRQQDHEFVLYNQSLKKMTNIDQQQQQVQIVDQNQQLQDNNRKKEIFSRQHVRGSTVKKSIEQQDPTINVHGAVNINQDIHNLEYQVAARLNSNDPYITTEFASTGNWAKSNRLSQQKLDGVSDYSYESSRLRKSPYNHNLQHMLKSQYYKPYSTSNQKQSKVNLFENNQEITKQYQEGFLKPQGTISKTQQQNSRNTTSIEFKKKNLLRKDDITTADQINGSLVPQANQTLSTCFFDTEVIPDFRQIKSQMLKKRRSVKEGGVGSAGQQPIFITSTKKGLGLQKECAKDHMINYKSSLGQKVLKVSIDDALKLKHQIWVSEKEIFQNNSSKDMLVAPQRSLPDSAQQTNQFNIANIVQATNNLLDHDHPDWTPKSSIVIEFQEPYKQQNPREESNSYSVYDSHQTSQQRSQLQMQNSYRNREKPNKIIYSFNKGSIRNSQKQGSRAGGAKVRRSNDSKHSRFSNNRKSKDVSDHPLSYANTLEGPDIQKINNDSGLLSQKESKKKLNSNKCENNSLEQDHNNIAKDVYQHDHNSQENSLEKTLHSRSYQGSRDNIEEAKDINVTSISIKVDQRKATAASIENVNTFERSKSQKSVEDTRSIQIKSVDMMSMERMRTATAPKQQRNITNKFKRAPKAMNQVLKSDGDRMKLLNTEPKIRNSQTQSRNLKISNNQDSNGAIQQYPHLNAQSVRKQVKPDLPISTTHEQEKFHERAKSAKNRSIPLNKANPIISPNNQQNNQLQPRTTKHKQPMKLVSDVSPQQIDQTFVNSPLRKLIHGSDFSKNSLSPLQSTKHRINIQKVNQLMVQKDVQSHTADQFLQPEGLKMSQQLSYPIIGTQERKSKNIISKLQGRSLTSAGGQTLRSNQSKQTLSRNFVKTAASGANRTHTVGSRANQDLSVHLANKKLEEEKEMIMIRDHDSSLTIDEFKRSIINDEDSTLLKKSFKDSTIDENERSQPQIMKPAIIQSRSKSGIQSIAVSSGGQSRTILRTTYDQFHTQKQFENDDKEPHMKRTILMKHKTQLEENPLNLQTGDRNRGSLDYCHMSIPQVQFIAQEDLNMNDLNLTDIMDSRNIVKQRKVTDLPRHSLAAPSVHKRNYELMQKMKKTEQLFFGAPKHQSTQMMMTFCSTASKKDKAYGETPSRNNTFYKQSQSMKMHESSKDHSDIMIDTTQPKAIAAPIAFEDMCSILPDIIQESDLKQSAYYQYQNVQIPMPRFMNSNSQFSTIKNNNNPNQQSRQTLNKSYAVNEESLTNEKANTSMIARGVSRENMVLASKPGSRENFNRRKSTKNDDLNLSNMSMYQQQDNNGSNEVLIGADEINEKQQQQQYQQSTFVPNPKKGKFSTQRNFQQHASQIANHQRQRKTFTRSIQSRNRGMGHKAAFNSSLYCFEQPKDLSVVGTHVQNKLGSHMVAKNQSIQ